MGLLKWSNESSVGIETVDNEHRELIDVINELCDAVQKGHEREQTGQLLHRLIECARGHFTSEEAMLLATDYPELAEHTEQHQSLLVEVEELAARFVHDGLILSDCGDDSTETPRNTLRCGGKSRLCSTRTTLETDNAPLLQTEHGQTNTAQPL